MQSHLNIVYSAETLIITHSGVNACPLVTAENIIGEQCYKAQTNTPFLSQCKKVKETEFPPSLPVSRVDLCHSILPQMLFRTGSCLVRSELRSHT